MVKVPGSWKSRLVERHEDGRLCDIPMIDGRYSLESAHGTDQRDKADALSPTPNAVTVETLLPVYVFSFSYFVVQS